MKYRNISKHNTRAAVLTLVLAVTLLLTTTFSVAFLHGNAASLQEKKTGWYAMQKDAVDLGFNGVLQNKFGSWFVEDGKVNFSYTGWLVCEGTYYYVTARFASDVRDSENEEQHRRDQQCNHSQGRNQFCEWHKLRFSDFQQRWQRLCF